MSPGSGMAFRRVAAPLAAAIMVLALGTAADVHAATSRAASASDAPACSPETTVQTAKGAVCGLTADGVTSYFSVPYAARNTRLKWAGSTKPQDRGRQIPWLFGHYPEGRKGENLLRPVGQGYPKQHEPMSPHSAGLSRGRVAGKEWRGRPSTWFSTMVDALVSRLSLAQACLRASERRGDPGRDGG